MIWAKEETYSREEIECIQLRKLKETVAYIYERVPAYREKMDAGDYTIRIEPTLPFQVRTASMLKKALKQIYSLGGDYVEILVSE